LQSEYINYRQLLRKEKRRKGDPESPDVYETCSTNSFAVQVAIWKQMLREYRPSREHGSQAMREDALDHPQPFGKPKPVTKAMTFNGSNGGNVNNGLNVSSNINGGSCNVVTDTHLPEDFRDRFTKMLAVGDENEDPMMASSGVFPAPETSSVVAGNNRMAVPLNQVSNHSSVSSGFGSAGSAASPSSSYVTAPNSDDSSGSGDWISVPAFNRRSSASDSVSKSSNMKASSSTPPIVRNQFNNNNNNNRNIQAVNQFSIYNKKPNARCFFPLGSDETQLTNCGKRKSNGGTGGNGFHRALLGDGANYNQSLLKKEKRRESDPTTLARRQKQINMGKNTLGYQRYEDVVPREKRAKHEPKTPDIFQVCSRRSWDMQVRIWRRMLHKYDPPDAPDGTRSSLQDDEIEDDVFDGSNSNGSSGRTSSMQTPSPALPLQQKVNLRADEFFANRTFPFASLVDHNENVCRIKHEFSDVLQGINGNVTLPCPFANLDHDDGFSHADQEEEEEEEGAWPQETREQVQKILSFLLDDSAEGNDPIDDDNKPDDLNDDWSMTSPEAALDPSSSSSGIGGGSGEQSLFGHHGLCYSSLDREGERAQPQLATFSSPPPIFSTPCRSNGSHSSKRNVRGALDFSGLFPGGNRSSKEADAAPKLLDDAEADSILWSRPSIDLADSGLGNSRSKEDPSFEELCEQTRMFEEVRVSTGGSTSNPSTASTASNFGAINSVGILDETTQSSWSGFEGRRNGANLNSFNFDPISSMTSVSAASDSFAGRLHQAKPLDSKHRGSQQPPNLKQQQQQQPHQPLLPQQQQQAPADSVIRDSLIQNLTLNEMVEIPPGLWSSPPPPLPPPSTASITSAAKFNLTPSLSTSAATPLGRSIVKSSECDSNSINASSIISNSNINNTKSKIPDNKKNCLGVDQLSFNRSNNSNQAAPPTFGPFNVAPPPIPVLQQTRPQRMIASSRGSQPPLGTPFSATSSFVQSPHPRGTGAAAAAAPPLLLTIPPPTFKGAPNGGPPPPPPPPQPTHGATYFGPIPTSTPVLSRPPPSMPHGHNLQQLQQQQSRSQFSHRNLVNNANCAVLHFQSRSLTYPLSHPPPATPKSFSSTVSSTPLATPLGTPLSTPLTTPRRPESSQADPAKSDDGLSKAERSVMLRQTFRNPSPPRLSGVPKPALHISGATSGLHSLSVTTCPNGDTKTI